MPPTFLEKVKKQKTVFKVGQKVWDSVLFPGREGVVSKVYPDNCPYLVRVRLDDDDEFSYTTDGRYYKSYAPTLSHEPYTITVVQKKKRKVPKDGEVVYVRDRWGIWGIRYTTGRVRGNGIECYRDQGRSGKSTWWCEWTTKNPLKKKCRRA